MSELRVHNLSMSLDGYAAGQGQSEEQPVGVGGHRLHEWIFDDAATDVDRRFLVPRRGRRGRHRHGSQHVRPRPRRLGSGRAADSGLDRLVG